MNATTSTTSVNALNTANSASSTVTKRLGLTGLALMAGVMSLVSGNEAQAASSGPYSMDVIVNGRDAREYYGRGTTYVEARQGQEYEIRLSNHTGERVAVALAVDGLNTIDAKHTSAQAARKWILAPYQTITVHGWQTSSSTARSFYFTSESGSYGAWMGDTRNLGNISAAFFREIRPQEPVYMTPQPYYRGYDEDSNELSRGDARNKSEAAAKSAPSAGTGAMRNSAPSASAESSARQMAPQAPRDELAATGIGRETRNDVYTTTFRAESAPSGVVTVRYEYRNKLIELGVLPRPYRPDPMVRRENSSGFSDYGYAPDPYRGR